MAGEIMNRRGFFGALLTGIAATKMAAQSPLDVIEAKANSPWLASGAHQAFDFSTQDDTSLVVLVDGKEIVRYQELPKSFPDYVRVRRGSGI
jgi:hypothetical protein